MEEEVCVYHKYGFCRYKEKCLKKHLKQECKDLNHCPDKKICHKRNPKLCRRYAFEGSCIFEEKCDYLHKEKEMSLGQNKLKERVEGLESVLKDKSSEEKIMLNAIKELEKVVKAKSSEEKIMQSAIKELEKVVKAMSRKVIFLEEEVKKIKEDSKNNKNSDLEDPFKDTSEFKISTPVSEKQKLPDVETKCFDFKKKKIKCKKCEYTCQKESTLTKHINTKHMNQECNVCWMKLGSTMELLQHKAKEHSSVEDHNIKEEKEIKSREKQDSDEVKSIKINEDMKGVDPEENNTSFVFSESKFFDEFL